MPLSPTQLRELLQGVATSSPDSLDCDGCCDLFAEFAEAELQGLALTGAYAAVRNHLRQCTCCAYEYETLLEALRATEDPDNA